MSKAQTFIHTKGEFLPIMPHITDDSMVGNFMAVSDIGMIAKNRPTSGSKQQPSPQLKPSNVKVNTTIKPNQRAPTPTDKNTPGVRGGVRGGAQPDSESSQDDIDTDEDSDAKNQYSFTQQIAIGMLIITIIILIILLIYQLYNYFNDEEEIIRVKRHSGESSNRARMPKFRKSDSQTYDDTEEGLQQQQPQKQRTQKEPVVSGAGYIPDNVRDLDDSVLKQFIYKKDKPQEKAETQESQNKKTQYSNMVSNTTGNKFKQSLPDIIEKREMERIREIVDDEMSDVDDEIPDRDDIIGELNKDYNKDKKDKDMLNNVRQSNLSADIIDNFHVANNDDDEEEDNNYENDEDEEDGDDGNDGDSDQITTGCKYVIKQGTNKGSICGKKLKTRFKCKAHQLL